MIKKIATIFILLAMLCASACFRQDIKTFTVETPQMKNRDCAEIIANAVRSIDGVRKVETHMPDRSVEVTYNSLKLAEKNVEIAISRAGFDANSILAKPKSRKRLPEELK